MEIASGNLFDWLTSHENSGVRLRQTLVFVIVCQHAENRAVVETKACQHHVGARKLQNLRIAQALNQLGDFVTDTKTKYGCGLVGSNHLLSQHQITQICIPNLSHHVISIHLNPRSKSTYN